MSDDRNFDDQWVRDYAREFGMPEPGDDPVISASALRKLAEEADRCGATRYAEAYRLVANRLHAKAKP